MWRSLPLRFKFSSVVDSQMVMTMNLLADGALDGSLRGGLGGRSVRAEGNTEVGDFSVEEIVDETCWEERTAKCMSQYCPGMGRSARGEGAEKRDPTHHERRPA